MNWKLVVAENPLKTLVVAVLIYKWTISIIPVLVHFKKQTRDVLYITVHL